MGHSGYDEHASTKLYEPFDCGWEGWLYLVEAIYHEEEEEMFDKKRGEPAPGHDGELGELVVEEVCEDNHGNGASKADEVRITG